MRRTVTVIFAVLALAACGRPLPPPAPLGSSAPGADPGDEVVCQDERTTGTNMSRAVCLTKDQVNENRRAAQEWEKHPRSDHTENR